MGGSYEITDLPVNYAFYGQDKWGKPLCGKTPAITAMAHCTAADLRMELFSDSLMHACLSSQRGRAGIPSTVCSPWYQGLIR